MIASSSADGLVENTTVEVESASTFYFTNDSKNQASKDAPFAAKGLKDVPIDAPSIAKVESKLVPMFDRNTNSKIKLQVTPEQVMKRMIVPEASSQPVVSSSDSVPPTILMLRKLAKSIYRFLYHIRTKYVGHLMGSLRKLWEPSAPRDAQRV
jgi:hypothetical protein